MVAETIAGSHIVIGEKRGDKRRERKKEKKVL
jgi:hypothetical protein